ncbi:MAG TPA: DUF1499 domain-containing protein [Burkholderiaceae bacterium]|nr:DUF1499 domain-containing protein [Burkholderiaceae bacterium]
MLHRLAIATIALLVVVFGGAQAGLLAGKRPARLGVVDGQLLPVRTQLTNAVSSAASTEYHRIAPLETGDDPAGAFARLRAVVASTPGARIVEERPGYLYAEYESTWLKFVDDVEFLLDAPDRVVHVRSASRFGRKDFGVNRARIEAIRARLGG